jgi:hypothetical protein
LRRTAKPSASITVASWRIRKRSDVARELARAQRQQQQSRRPQP